VTLLVLACALPSSVADDADGDGYTVAEGDCDDHDDDVSPAEDEVCNKLDDDCDGTVDAGACTTYDPEADEVVTIEGEGRLGDAMAVGLLDGDAVPDLVTTASIEGADAVCIAGGARLTPGETRGIAGVANCWVAEVLRAAPVVVRADRYDVGLPPGQGIALVGNGASICALNPYSRALSIDQAAHGCVAVAELPAEFQTNLKLLPADVDRGTLAATGSVYLAVIDPVDYLAGTPANPTVVEFPGRVGASDGGADLDGDGVSDLIVSSGSRAYLVPGDIDVTGPVEFVTPRFVDAVGVVSAVGDLGDVNGDGSPEWYTMSGSTTEVWSGETAVSSILGVHAVFGGAGDFNGDGLADVWAGYEPSDEETGFRLILGGGWASSLYVSEAYTLGVYVTATSARPVTLGGVDVFGDGYGDTWLAEPRWPSDEEPEGRLMLLGGWGISPNPEDPGATTTDIPL